MPPYVVAPIGFGSKNPPAMLLPGQPFNSFGTYSDTIPSTRMNVFQSAESAGNVITLSCNMWEGPIPVVGQKITTYGLTNVLNASGFVITAVTGFGTSDTVGSAAWAASVGTGTVSYDDPDDTGLIAAAPDFSLALCPQQAVPDALSVSSGLECALQFDRANDKANIVAWSFSFPSAPSSVTMNLEAALEDTDGAYQVLDTSSNASGELRYVQNVRFNFLRMTCSATEGGSSPTVIGQILI